MKKFFSNIQFPPFFYVKAFWESLTTAVAGVLGLLVFFGVLSVEWAVGGATLLTWVYSVLKFFDVEPQVRLRAALLDAAKVVQAEKKAKTSKKAKK